MSEADPAGRVFLGVADWERPDWQAAFYPEELPEEWRIAYYANQFLCVWIGREVWSRLAPAEAERWLAETPDYFRFVLEAPDGDAGAGGAIPEILRPRLGRICLADDPALAWFDAETDLGELSAVLQARNLAEENFFLLSRDGNLVQIERVNNLLQLLGL
jgi:hypothetical protein